MKLKSYLDKAVRGQISNRAREYKVYLKNPEKAPSGVRIRRGKRGGFYYEKNRINYNIGNYNSDSINIPELNALHPSNLTEEQKLRFGDCHVMEIGRASCRERV